VAKVLAIVNPAAGKARGAGLRAQAAEELRRLFPDIAFVETEGPGHATLLARQAKDAELVIAIGGDGTTREVASGLVSSTGILESSTPRPLLAVIPVGSCNDLLKTLGSPADVIQACRVARQGAERSVDVILVEMAGEGKSQQTHFINAAGFGFDARVTAEAHKSKHLSGMPLYIVAIIRALSDLKCPLVRIRAAGFEAEQRVLMIAAANGRYYGGGMKVAPEAQPDDGLMEVCIADSMGPFSALQKLPRFVAGTHVTLEEVRMLRAPELELEFLEPVLIELDGDLILPQPFTRYRLSVLPRAISIRVP